jgi:purine-cytosine permease-like protein
MLLSLIMVALALNGLRQGINKDEVWRMVLGVLGALIFSAFAILLLIRIKKEK